MFRYMSKAEALNEILRDGGFEMYEDSSPMTSLFADP